MRSDVPVVLVEGNLNNLGVIRSLSVARMPIYILETTRNCAAGWSRFCTFVRVPNIEGYALVEKLIVLGRNLGNRPVLFLGGDQNVITVSNCREQIAPLYRISLPCSEMVLALSDKTLFQTLAEREGFPVPRAVAVNGKSDLKLLHSLVPPLVIKPADKILVLSGVVERALRANTMLEAETYVGRMLERSPRVIVQEWIDGPDNEIFFTLFSCDRHSNVIGMFTGRKLVCTPPDVGTTAICVSAPEAAKELHAIAMKFISRVKYRGLGSLEFKRDRRTGRLMIIEPTVGRTDWQEEIATLCGVNLPLLTYEAELGEPVAANAERANSVAWRSSIEHRLTPGVLKPGTRMVDAFFRWSDPLPAVYFYGGERFASRIWRRAKSYYRQIKSLPKRKTDV